MSNRAPEVEAIYALSPLQQGMLFHTLLSPRSGVYFAQLRCDLRGDLDVPRFWAAWEKVQERHAVLRTAFAWERLERPMQVVQRRAPLPAVELDWRALPPARREAELSRFLAEDRERGFNPARAPLMRLTLVRLEDDLHHFIWSNHHLLIDGWSVPIVLREVFTAYEAGLRGLSPQWPPARPYRDYIAWLKRQDMNAAEGFWRRTLAGFTSPTPLGIDRPGRTGEDGDAAGFDELPLDLAGAELAALRSFAARHRLTLSTLVQGAWALLLSRYSGEQDVVFGTTVSGRPADLPGVESMVGLFINTLPVRLQVSPEEPAADWLLRLQSQQAEQRQLEYTPLVDITRWSEVPRGGALFESLVIFENYPLDSAPEGGRRNLIAEGARSTVYSNYPLALLAIPGPDSLQLRAKYDRGRLERPAVASLLEQLQGLLGQLASIPQARLGALSLVTAGGLALLPDPTVPLESPRQELVAERLRHWALHTPEAPAVRQGDRAWSYRELVDRAEELARELLARGLAPGDRVAVEGARSFGLIASLAGVLASGGTLLPLDPALPPERRELMLRQSGARFRLAAGAAAEALESEIGVDGQSGRPVSPRPEAAARRLPELSGKDPAYLFYTSGTTGTPKGVLGSQQGLAHFLAWQSRTFAVAPGDRAAQLTGLSFDVVMRDVFVALVSGATLCLPEEGLPLGSPEVLGWLARDAITLLHVVPSVAQSWLLEPPAGLSLERVRCAFFAGEPLTGTLVGRWRAVFGPSARIVNLYGPTETTLAKCFHVVEEARPGSQPVGRPLPQTQALVLSPERRLCGIGEVGEIAIRTPFRSLGYLGLPAENGSRFPRNPFRPGAGEEDRIYLTGDRGRVLPDGTLEVLGRVDDQIKIRGVRVEPGEVSAALSSHPGVRSCFVLGRRDEAGEGQLVAYVVAEREDAELEAELRAYLGRRLPLAMMPAAFVFLPRLPLTPNGKVDRRALPAPAVSQTAGRFVAPRSAEEEIIAGIWSEVLRREPVGAEDNFFDLGGHSLLATQIVSRLRQAFGLELPLRALFEEPTVAGLAQRVEALRHGGQGPLEPPLTASRRPGPPPLSFSQQRLWFLHQLEPDSPSYNLPGGLRLDGALDVPALRRTLSEIARRHEPLRTSFTVAGGQPAQIVHPPSGMPLPVLDLGSLPSGRAREEAARLAEAEARAPFDLTAGPLLRARLVRLAESSHLALFTMHHIISDGWSRGVFVREIAALYDAFTAGRPSPLPDLPLQYADYASWQRDWLTGEVLESQLQYWKTSLVPLPAALDLPTDRPRPPVKSFRGDRRSLRLSPEPTEALRKTGRKEGVTLFMTLLAAFNLLLERHGGSRDFAVGSPVANRRRKEIEELIGFFVNTLVLRTDLTGDPTVRALLGRVREVALGAFAHQDLPFERLVEELQPERDLGQTPLFQAMLVLHNTAPQDLALRGLTLSPLTVDSRATKFDLTLVALETVAGLSLALEYDTDLFDATTAERQLRHLEALLGALAAAPDRRISEIPMVSEGERHQLVAAWNDAGLPPSSRRCVHHLFEDQVERSPEAVAVIGPGGSRLTYRELNRRANALARRLRALGVGPESLVALLCGREPALIAGMLAILKAGGAYVPIDPRYPAERVRFMLEDSRPRALLVLGERGEAALATAPGCPVLDLATAAGPDGDDLNPAALAAPENAAYVIYTSGSTGRPKGVLVEHRQLLNYLGGIEELYGFAPGLSSALVQPVAFDSAVTAVYPPLLHGGVVHLIAEEAVSDPEVLGDYFTRHRIDGLKISPSHLAALQTASRPERVLPRRWLVVGGEALRREPAEAIGRRAPGCAIFNEYGPTEATVGMLVHRLGPEPRHATATLPVGRPLPGTRALLLDRDLRPVPCGVRGEIYIGGSCLARGYLERPELTAERFVPNPFPGLEGGERLYRTGDLARWLPDGNVEFLGRLDHQVKVRGFRVELGEVESALCRHPGVLEAAVVPTADGQALTAYLVPRAEPPAPRELAGHLARSLPQAMLPAYYVPVAELPRDRHGKLDRRALPDPATGLERTVPAAAASRTPVEDLLAGIWCEVLGREAVSLHDSFFDLGGHSLLATQITSRVRGVLGVELPVKALFEAPTVAALAARIEGLRTAPAAPPIERVSRQRPLPLSFAQQRLWFLHQLETGTAAYNLAGALRLRGRLEPAVLAAALREIERRHETLRTSFASPDGLPVQVVHPPQGIPLPQVDLSSLPAPARQAELSLLATAEARQPFDLARGPVARVRLLRLAEEEHVVLFTLHHIASDAWSQEILVREMGALYRAFLAGEGSPLPELPIQYADFAEWQRRWMSGPVLAEQLAYWRRQLAGLTGALALPTDRQRPAVRSARGGRYRLELGGELTGELRRQSRQRGATLFMTLLAAFSALLQRLTGQTDLAVGSPIASRNRKEIEGLIGFFVNTLVLRADLAGEPSFRQLTGRVRAMALEAYAHQDLPFERLVEELRPERSLDRSPLFQVLLAFQSTGSQAELLPGLALESAPLDGGAAKFDLTLYATEGQGGLALLLEHSTDLFDRATGVRWLRHLQTLLTATAARPDDPVQELPVLDDGDRQQILRDWNDTRREIPGPGALHELLEVQARRTPDAPALIWGTEALSYRELDRRADRLARRLRAVGVGLESLVGICLERSPDMVAGLLAILKAGGAYVPLDPSYPRERLAFIVEDAGIAALLSTPALIGQLGLDALCERLPRAAAVVLIEGPPEEAGDETAVAMPAVAPQGLAYLIYTSGSTGRPKGVAITHGSAVELAQWASRVFTREEMAGVLASTSICFDLSVFELFVPLHLGGSVILVENALALAALPRETPVTLVNTVPSAMTELLRLNAVPDALRTVNLAGEPLPGKLLADLLASGPIRRVWNLYGPSEDTTYSTGAWFDRGGVATPPIGRPIDNTAAYVLDATGRVAPAGVPGELYLGGAGLARGYQNRPDQTAERFVPCPFGDRPGARLYRTGDLARWLPAGDLEFLGRTDHQVKLRGFRIELGEIEAALLDVPGVQATVVIVGGAPADPRLVAYVAAGAEAGEDLVASCRALLGRRLPGYMVPASFVVLEQLPLTPNGKVDRKALPSPEPLAALADLYVPPVTDDEKLVAEVWAEVLGVERPGAQDDFFALGGHSLLAVRLVTRLRQRSGVNLPLRALFEAPTVAGVALALAAARREDACGSAVALDLAAEAVLDPAIRAEGAARPADEPRRILLTGATGFLGPFLLAELLRSTRAEVHCLVRAAGAESARAKLRAGLAAQGLWDERWAARLQPEPGDLSLPRLGLGEERFAALSEQLDAIVHNGAWVNVSYPYSMLKAANVQGTEEVLRLAARSRLKPVHFVSTLSVFFSEAYSRLEVIPEDDPLDHPDGSATGYAASKWVAEKLIAEARTRGIPASVYRLGRITWDSRDGGWNENDALYHILNTCLRLGSAPDVPAWLDMTPVDFVARAIVALAFRPGARAGAFHILNPQRVAWPELVRWISAEGYPMRLIPYEDWMAEVARRAESAPDQTLLALLALGGGESPAERGRREPDTRNAAAGLAGTGVDCPPVDRGQVRRMLERHAALPALEGSLQAAGEPV
jgi:amino acid adenylation domain-containing protein/thioester reductase-like protein